MPAMLPVLIILGIVILLLALPVLQRRRHRRRRAALQRREFPADWIEVLRRQVPLYNRLPEDLRTQLHGHIQVLLAEKDFHGAAGFEVTEAMRLTVAAQAALLLLNRPVEYFPDLYSIVLHPAQFLVDRETWDAAGLRHNERQVLSGESWEQGQLVLSWDDSLHGGMNSDDGYNVVLHEFAHQLDLESGAMNGMPALESAAQRDAWAATFSAAYDDHCARVDAGENTWLDPYAATAPAEFFAVVTEAFFELPRELGAEYPEVHTRLREYYRVDPSGW